MRRSLWFCGVVAMAAGVAFAQETLVPRMPAATCGGYNFWAYDGRARVELDKYCRERIPLSETQRLLCDLVESQILSKKVAEWTDLAGASCAPLNQEDVAVTWLEICRESGGPPHFGHFAGNEPMYASSLAQLFYAVAAYKKLADQGISQSKIESDIEAMLAENDYEAANRVVDFVTGTESGDELTGGDFKAFKRQRNVVNRYFRDLGFENFNVNQKFWTDTPSPRDLQLLGKPLSQNYEHSNRVTANQVAALAYLIDREAIVKNITQAEQKPAYAFVPYGFKDADGKDFRANGGDFFKYDVAEAKRLLAEAGYPDGKGFPKLKILFNTSENHQKIAQAIQQMWKQNLGIEVALESQEWQVYLESEDQLNYDIVRAGWSPDYLDPMTFIDMFVTNGGNNDTGWSNKKYDALVNKAKSTGDQKVRMQAMHEAEKILMEEMPIAPIYFYTNPNLIRDNIKGVIIPPFGTYADFKWAYVE